MLTLVLQGAVAQDYIVKLNGDEIPARVLEVTLEDVVYHHPDSAEALTSRMPKSEVFMIRFENGTKEVFTKSQTENGEVAAEQLTPEQQYLLGQQDVHKYYKGNGVMWGSAASTVVFFPFGLAGAAVLGLTPPKAHWNNVPDNMLLSNPDYVRGYEEEAKRKKRRKAAAGAGIGSVVAVTVATIAIMSALNGMQ